MGQNEGAGLTNPLAALGSGLASAFTAQGAVNQVDNFLAHNCGIPGQ
jgi:hypothetical protein